MIRYVLTSANAFVALSAVDGDGEGDQVISVGFWKSSKLEVERYARVLKPF